MRRRVVLWALWVPIAAFGLVRCGSDGEVSDAPIDAGVDAGVDAAVDAFGTGAGGPSDASTGPDAPASCGYPRPDVIPDGWTQWSGRGCPCNFWIPPDEAHMPPPIAWEACPPEVAQVLPGIECQRMTIDWPFDHSEIAVGGYIRYSVDTAGRPLLLFMRIATQGGAQIYNDEILAEADGPVRWAMRKAGSLDGCTMLAQDLNEERFAVQVNGDGLTPVLESNVDGLIWGQLGSIEPTAGMSNTDVGKWNYSIGREWIVKRFGPPLSATMHSLDLSISKDLWTGGDPDSLFLAPPTRVVGRDILMNVGNYNMAGIMAYDDAQGVHPLVRWYGDLNRGAGNVATDGKVLVWTYGEGKPPGEMLYTKTDVMAAPYTTDPAQLQPVRLRSDPGRTVLGNPFEVGCGFAGHDLSGGEFIVRLSDGESWTMPHAVGWIWISVLGFTCDEVFLRVQPGSTLERTIARVKLSSLGPSTPPD